MSKPILVFQIPPTQLLFYPNTTALIKTHLIDCNVDGLMFALGRTNKSKFNRKVRLIPTLIKEIPRILLDFIGVSISEISKAVELDRKLYQKTISNTSFTYDVAKFARRWFVSKFQLPKQTSEQDAIKTVLDELARVDWDCPYYLLSNPYYNIYISSDKSVEYVYYEPSCTIRGSLIYFQQPNSSFNGLECTQ
jgi:hypothetical protein